MIVCGWCGEPTKTDPCRNCGRDPFLPWTQRGQVAPSHDPADHRQELARAIRVLRSEGRPETVEELADVLDVSPRTVRRWQQKAP